METPSRPPSQVHLTPAIPVMASAASMSSGEYTALMEQTDAQLPSIEAEYAPQSSAALPRQTPRALVARRRRRMPQMRMRTQIPVQRLTHPPAQIRRQRRDKTCNMIFLPMQLGAAFQTGPGALEASRFSSPTAL